MTPDEYDAQKAAEIAAAGAEHGLTTAEVLSARAAGMRLDRYAAVKKAPLTLGGGRSVLDVAAAMLATPATRSRSMNDLAAEIARSKDAA